MVVLPVPSCAKLRDRRNSCAFIASLTRNCIAVTFYSVFGAVTSSYQFIKRNTVLRNKLPPICNGLPVIIQDFIRRLGCPGKDFQSQVDLTAPLRHTQVRWAVIAFFQCLQNLLSPNNAIPGKGPMGGGISVSLLQVNDWSITTKSA